MATGSRSGSLSSLREFNRLRLVDFLRTNGTASRAELARRTGLSRSTVSTLVADLQRRGLVVERAGQFAGEGQPGPPGGAARARSLRGRRRRRRLRPRQGARRRLRPVAQRARRGLGPHDVDHDAQGALDLAAELVERVLDETRPAEGPPARRGHRARRPDRPRQRRSSPVGRPARLGRRRRGGRARGPPRLPAYVDNDANLGALAEVTLGAGRNASFAAYVSISSGIGAGIIVEGRPYRGHRGTAGEIGHSSSTRRARSAAAATAAASRRWPPDRRS